MFGPKVAMQPDGKILVSGAQFNGRDNDFVVLRYLTTGLATEHANTNLVIGAISPGLVLTEAIAREFARRFADADLHVDNNAVVRIRETDVQQRLNWIERRRNVRGAFAATRSLAGESVLLVDDVLTTGATLNELARVALAAGAAQVDALVLARVQPLRRRERTVKFNRAVT